MPEIAVAANIAAAKPAPGADNSSAAPASEPGSDGPFAAVLQRQMDSADHATAAAMAADAASAGNPQVADLAAFLPMLMGSALMADNNPAQGVGQGTAKKSATSDIGIDPAAAIALPAAVPAAVVTPTPATAAEPTAAKAPPEPAASNAPAATTPAPANLAAAPDSAAPDAKPAAKTGQAFDTSVTDAMRSASAPTAAIHAAAAAAGNAVADAASAGRGHVVASPVGSQAWGAEIGDRLVWMTNNQNSRAELVLTPPQLGKIEISVTMSGDHATATFVSASPVVRDAIENALPRLREILADAGVTLGQTQVGSDAPKQGTDQFRDNSFAGPTATSSDGGLRTPATGVAAWTAAGRGLVDVFA